MAEDFIQDALLSIAFYYSTQIIILLLCVFFCIRQVLKNHPGSDKYGYLTIVLVVLIIAQLSLGVFPFLQDCFHNNISIAQGIYTNKLGDVSKSHSSTIDMDSVTLAQGTQEIHLTTYPFNDGQFPAGNYEVIAYYTQKSEFLLHIEIIREIAAP